MLLFLGLLECRVHRDGRQGSKSQTSPCMPAVIYPQCALPCPGRETDHMPCKRQAMRC